jgi:glycerophosphoryl diester phosphodiesterase
VGGDRTGAGARLGGLHIPYTTPEMVERAHAVGMGVMPWTVDDAATMQALIDMGAGGIITDYPDRLRDVLAANGLPLPRRYPGRR